MRYASIISAASVLALALSAPGLCARGATPSPKPPKSPTAVVVRVVNESHNCAWVTIYAARIYTPWMIMHGPKIADVSAEDKNIPTTAMGMVANLHSELSGDPATGGRFSITLHQR